MATSCAAEQLAERDLDGCRARGTTSPLPETIDRPQAALSMTTTLRNNRLHSGRRCWPGLRFLKAEENSVERRQDDQGQERRHEQTPHDSEGHRPPRTPSARSE